MSNPNIPSEFDNLFAHDTSGNFVPSGIGRADYYSDEQEPGRVHERPSNRLLFGTVGLAAGVTLTGLGLALNYGSYGGHGNDTTEAALSKPSASAPLLSESPSPSRSIETTSSPSRSASPTPTPSVRPSVTKQKETATATPRPTESTEKPKPTPAKPETPDKPSCEWPSIGANQYTVADCGSKVAYDEPGQGEFTLTEGFPFEAQCVTGGFIRISVANSSDYIKNPSYFDASSLPAC